MKEYYIDFFSENPFTKEIYLQYVLPDKSLQLLQITPANLTFENIGLFTTNDGKDNDYRNIMMQQVFNFAQSQGQGMEAISNLVLSITQGESPETVHKRIMAATKEQEQRAAAIQAQLMQAQAETTDKDGVSQEKEEELIDAKIRNLDKETEIKERESLKQN
jgi:hypothetical protein